MSEPEKKARAGTTWATKAVASGGVIAAMMLAVLLNVLSARHFKRWDFTRGGVYTLSDATKETLHALEQPIKVHVLLPSSDPLSVAVAHMLDSYRAESSRIEVEATDPDKNRAEFLAVQQRFGVVAGKTDDGRIVTDAQIIVVKGDRPHFITSRDLVEVDDADDARARPRIEQALTAAIRDVAAKDPALVCFTSGHGEYLLEAGGDKGLGGFRDRLVKNNFGVKTLAPAKGETPENVKLLSSCHLLVIADPDEHVAKEDVDRWVSFVEKGGNALVVVQSQPNADQDKYLALGLDDLLGLAGLKLDDGFVFELDSSAKAGVGIGETFVPKPRPHAITEGFLKAGPHAPPIVFTMATPLVKTGGGRGAPVPLLETSEKSFGMRDFMAWKNHPSEPTEAGPKDLKGPVDVAWATELPKPAGSNAAHGPRMVVIGSAVALANPNWQVDEFRGNAIFVQSAVSWLTARPAMLDIPKKPAFATAFHLSEEDLSGVFRRSVIYLPLTSLLAGAAVYLARRNDRRGAKKKPGEDDAKKKPKKKKKPDVTGEPGG